MKTYDTLTEAIDDLRKQGYVNDFNLHPEWIECPPLNLKMKPQQFLVEKSFRFEGMSSTDDNTVLYAISSEDGVKGLLVDAYGVYSNAISPEMIDRLKIKYNS